MTLTSTRDESLAAAWIRLLREEEADAFFPLIRRIFPPVIIPNAWHSSDHTGILPPMTCDEASWVHETSWEQIQQWGRTMRSLFVRAYVAQPHYYPELLGPLHTWLDHPRTDRRRRTLAIDAPHRMAQYTALFRQFAAQATWIQQLKLSPLVPFTEAWECLMAWPTVHDDDALRTLQQETLSSIVSRDAAHQQIAQWRSHMAEETDYSSIFDARATDCHTLNVAMHERLQQEVLPRALRHLAALYTIHSLELIRYCDDKNLVAHHLQQSAPTFGLVWLIRQRARTDV